MSKGIKLAKKLGLDCKQALFSAWGNFYARITQYPCILFDDQGYLIIKTSVDLDRFGIKVLKRTNVPAKISSVPEYQFFENNANCLPGEVSQKNHGPYIEGSVEQIKLNRYERDRRARAECLKHYGYACFVCGITLSNVYGAVAENFIHVHHIIPLSKIGRDYSLNPIKDLRPLCPNCHAVLHLCREPLSIEEMQTIWKQKSVHNIAHRHLSSVAKKL